MRNQNSPDVILLTGAGASGYFGLATLEELLGKASTSMIDDGTTEFLLDVKRAIEAQRPSNAIFEEIISRLRFYNSMIATLRTDLDLQKRIGHLPSSITTGQFEHTLWKALATCYRTFLNEYGPQKIDFHSQEVQTSLKLFEKLAEQNGRSLHVFTTNYDCAYQVLAAKTHALNFLTHIDSSSGHFGDHWCSTHNDLRETQFPEIYIHRLHGCVGWFNDDRVAYRIFEVFGAGENLEIKDEALLQRMCIKLVSSEEIGLNAAFLSAFQEFNECLNTATCLLVWGFSFRDREVLRAINNAFYSRKTPLPIYYINPFLPEGMAMENIRRTLGGVPVKVADQFRPKQIPWRVRQSGDELVQLTLSALKEVI